MKIEKYRGLGTKTLVKVTRNEAISLIETLSYQLFQGKRPSGRTEMITDKGERFDILIDFNEPHCRCVVCSDKDQKEKRL